MFASRPKNEPPKSAIVVAGIALVIVAGVLLLGSFAHAQDNGISLGELARRERERKAAAAHSEKPPDKIIDLLDIKRDCGADWTCFLAAFKDGKPARITFQDAIDASYSTDAIRGKSLADSADDENSADHPVGMAIHSDVVLETDKLTEDSAVLSGTTKNTTVFLTDPERARLLLRGYTRDAIDARERRAQQKAASRDGLFVTCVFQKKALQQFLENRKEGEFSERDWELADHCDGPDPTASSNPPASSSKP
jgi:hypothetical protein